MSFYFGPEKIKQYVVSVASFLLAFTLSIFVAQYFFQGIAAGNQPYVFALIVFVLYFTIQLTVQNAQLYFWPYLKPYFTISAVASFSDQTKKALHSWQNNVFEYLQHNHVIQQPRLLLYDVAQKRYCSIFSESGQSLAANHALVYVAKQGQQTVISSAVLHTLPEVTALDIQWLMKQHHASQVIPIGVERGTVCGFIFCNGTALSQSDGEQINKLFGTALRQIIQHDAVTRPINMLNIKPSKISWPVGVTLMAFLILTIYWLASYPYMAIQLDNKFLFIFSNIYGVVAAWGGVWALLAARQWRSSKNISRALLCFGVGLLLQEFGQLSYVIYWQVWNVVIPYPSVGDIGYFGSVLSYLVAVIFLARASGVASKIITLRTGLFVLFVPTAFLSVSFFLFLQGTEFDLNNPLKLFLDLGYPIIEAIYLSIAILTYLLTRDSGGKLRNQVFMILLALIWQFACDFVFIYQASRGTWVPNGVNDYMYLVSYVLMTLVILKFRNTSSKK